MMEFVRPAPKVGLGLARPKEGLERPALPKAGLLLPARPKADCELPVRPKAGFERPALPKAGLELPVRPKEGLVLPARPKVDCEPLVRPKVDCDEEPPNRDPVFVEVREPVLVEARALELTLWPRERVRPLALELSEVRPAEARAEPEPVLEPVLDRLPVEDPRARDRPKLDRVEAVSEAVDAVDLAAGRLLND